MNEQILEILNQYNNHHRYADTSFIDIMCKIIIDNNKLNNYVKKIYVINKKRGMNNHYSYTDSYLYFNLAKEYDKFIKHFDSDNYYYYYNLLVLTIIFHEMTHVYQEKIKNNDDDLLLKSILLLSDPITYLPIDLNNKGLKEQIVLLYKWKKYQYYYRVHYLKAPEERMAIINSYLHMQEIIVCLDSNIKHINFYNNYLNFSLDNILKYGYHLVENKTNSPTLDYLKKMPDNDNPIILKNRNFITNTIPYNERLFMGLTLTAEEFHRLMSNEEIKIKKLWHY